MVNSTKTYKAIKYILFVGCYLFWVSSAILIAVGVYAKVAKEGDVVDSLTADPALLFICIGSLMFTVTFFGCFGALRDNVRLLQIFVGILVAILLLRISAAVLGFIFSDLVLERTDLLIKTGIEKYRDDLDLENIIDFVQKKFQCCGGHSYRDWSYNVYFNCSKTNPSVERCGVPFSCCIQQKKKSVLNTMCGYGTQQEVRAGQSIYTTGCLDKITKWGEQNLLLLAGMAAGLLSLEICMVSLAAALIHQIKLKMTKEMEK
ncbi:tetraspanin-33 isoform X1 [Brienomyrus brachyistius]|uniref:tetraspanin-33 isoform X1 n=1 Tax=Brienomyrus brachyistius TaxID=42636 RepID=UPI0020B2AB78|nr:tetraspanin-33 isoform X1 [Brienomyrus brachyistius]